MTEKLKIEKICLQIDNQRLTILRNGRRVRAVNLGAYEKNWEKMKENPEAMKKMEEAMKGYQDMYLTGSREIFQVW